GAPWPVGWPLAPQLVGWANPASLTAESALRSAPNVGKRGHKRNLQPWADPVHNIPGPTASIESVRDQFPFWLPPDLRRQPDVVLRSSLILDLLDWSKRAQ